MLALAVPVVAVSMFQSRTPEWLSGYMAATPSDTIAGLQQKIDSGDVNLEFEKNGGYLRSVLRALNIPVSSQTLVYSRTSFQLDRIAPWAPRAVYFNDDTYVGWVPSGPVLEVASVDPDLGAVFYTLDQKAGAKPKFERQGFNCLQCHDSMVNTGGIPGFMVRSVYVDRSGYPMAAADSPVSTDRTSFRQRFGGWYVTGTSGDQLHMGNFVSPKLTAEIGNTENYLHGLNLAATDNITDLSKLFRIDGYPAKTSDIVALDASRPSDESSYTDDSGQIRSTHGWFCTRGRKSRSRTFCFRGRLH